MNIDIRIQDEADGTVALTISSPDGANLITERCPDTDTALERAMAWADAMKQVAAMPNRYPGT